MLSRLQALRIFLLPLLDILFPPRTTEVLVRNADISQLHALVRPVQAQPRTNGMPESIIALLPYRDPLVQALILETKFHRNKRAQKLLGEVLGDYIKVYIEQNPEKYEEKPKLALIPLPLGAKRRKERGYNQVEEIAKQTIAQSIAKSLNLTLILKAAMLIRLRETVPQMTLGRAARLENMHGAFGAVHPIDPSAIYILLDDVFTTGATLSSAAAALRAAGITHLYIVALAH